MISHDFLADFTTAGSVPKGNLAQRGVSGLAEGLDSVTGGTAAQQFRGSQRPRRRGGGVLE